MVVIETIELTRRFKDFTAVDTLSMQVEKGDIFGFIGPNGAGKTTTLRILATLLAPSSGKAYIKDIDVMKDPYEVKKVVGFMPDSFGVYDGMRLREYLDFFAAAYKIPSAKRKVIIDDVLELTDLTTKADDFVGAFSRGMRQRCCLAKTLIHDPEVLILDEPASGLDPRARIDLRELLKTLRDMAKTILISSHILSELGDMCNKIAIIERGKLLAVGQFKEIMQALRQTREIRLELLDGADTAAQILEETSGIVNVQRSGTEFQLETDLGSPELSALLSRLVLAGVKVLFFEEQKGSLEDVFLHVTRGEI